MSRMAHALPEESLRDHAHTQDNVRKEIDRAAGTADGFRSLQKNLSRAGIDSLDNAWQSATHFPSGGCKTSQRDCRAFSRFGNAGGNAPIVLLPGFTGYRKMYIEQVIDLAAMGYGPIYVLDFIGTGDSGMNYLAPGETIPTMSNYLAAQSSEVRDLVNSRVKEIAGSSFDNAMAAIKKLPVGRGHVDDFSDYNSDVNNVMLQAVSDNPGKKITITALSMSGLVILDSLAQAPSNATSWISHVKTLVLESPMIRLKAVPSFLNVAPELLADGGKVIKGSTTAAGPDRSLPEFVNKALGHFDPNNAITHSEIRLTLTDGMRAWNGAETAGATFGWAAATLKAQFQMHVTEVLARESLNYKLDNLKKVFNKNQITLIAITSLADPVVEPKATIEMMGEFGGKGIVGASLCLFQTAKHVIDQETDKYRLPYLNLLEDLTRAPATLAKIYSGPGQEPLVCEAIGARRPASVKRKGAR